MLREICGGTYEEASRLFGRVFGGHLEKYLEDCPKKRLKELDFI